MDCSCMINFIDENDSDLPYSEVPLKEKNKTLVKILGAGSSTQDDPCRSNIGWGGGRDARNPCGVDAYVMRSCRARAVTRPQWR